MIATLVWAATIWVVAGGMLLALAYRRAIVGAWQEPALRVPVLILESDDWGYGPPAQATHLDRIADLLAGFRDAYGRHPVMTLGVVLAGPDVAAMRSEGSRVYHRLTLADRRLAAVRDAMLRGVSRGVFALQLHGMEHYWPECLMRASRSDKTIANWLVGHEFPSTEALPSALQSRWIDALELPSAPLPRADVTAAATEEARVFADVFGMPAEVAVPPTFVWTSDVESAWARAGVRVVVTPGRRCESRDREARPVSSSGEHFNGAVGEAGISYTVRNNYFEPALGHTHERPVRDLERNTRLGRPTLVEIHRMNFIGEERQAETSFDEIARLLRSVCAAFPSIQFMSTAELARHYRDRSDVVERRLAVRVHVLLARLAAFSRLRKLAWITGVVLPAWLAYRATGAVVSRGSRA